MDVVAQKDAVTLQTWMWRRCKDGCGGASSAGNSVGFELRMVYFAQYLNGKCFPIAQPNLFAGAWRINACIVEKDERWACKDAGLGRWTGR